jgi:hypothetical protein
LVLQSYLRHSVESWASVTQTFRHSKVTICSERSDETSLLFILFVEPDLIVP